MRKIFSILAVATAVFVSAEVLANVIAVGQIVYPTVTIASGSTSGTVSTAGLQLVGCQIPAVFTGTGISFVAGTTLNGSYQELDNSSGKVSYTVAQGKYISISPADFAGVQFFKIISNASETTSRSLLCSMKGM